jgi:hypothetical protein
MADLDKQRNCATFCLIHGKTVSEKQEKLKTDFDENVKKKQNFVWFSLTKCGENSAEDSVRSERPSAGRTNEKL